MTKKDLLIITAVFLLISLLTWLPFLAGFGGGLSTLFKNYDGPNYVVIAKSGYNASFIRSHFSLPTPVEYYPAHLPAYSVSIAFFNFFLPGPVAMLASTLVFTILATITFYLFLKKFKLSENPLWLSLVFLVFPARWIAVKAVGSPEPLFIFAILASFYFFKCKKFLLAGLFGALAQITKSPGILLFLGYLSYLSYLSVLERNLKNLLKNSLPLLLIPFSALAVFVFYKFRTGDFLAYFHSGDNFHLFFPPYQAFSQTRSWLGDFWREDLVWQYLFGALAVTMLIKRKLFDLAGFAGIFFTATLFIAHRDIARYSLPLVPFALIAFDEFIQKKEFKIALLIVLPAIYLYAINFIAGNIAPIADWAPYL